MAGKELWYRVFIRICEEESDEGNLCKICYVPEGAFAEMELQALLNGGQSIPFGEYDCIYGGANRSFRQRNGQV